MSETFWYLHFKLALYNIKMNHKINANNFMIFLYLEHSISNERKHHYCWERDHGRKEMLSSLVTIVTLTVCCPYLLNNGPHIFILHQAPLIVYLVLLRPSWTADSSISSGCIQLFLTRPTCWRSHLEGLQATTTQSVLSDLILHICFFSRFPLSLMNYYLSTLL
jgi:hypothetical protein